jgi:hypothetical protein
LPKASARWTIRLPLPLREWHAYDSPQDQPTAPRQIRSVRYLLEVIYESDLDEPADELLNFPGVFDPVGLSETLEASTTLTTPITLLQRTDPFERFA